MSLIEDMLAAKPPGLIYHYTSNEGFLGIIEKRTLWASKLHYLNDATEFAYALGLVKEVLEARLKGEGGPQKEFYKLALEGMSSIEDVHIFVACFSEAGDLLSQWRGYCPNSVGYSIAFSGAQMQKSMQRQGFRLVRCAYDPDQQSGIVKELVDSAAESIAQTSPSLAAQELVRRMPEVAPALKHPQFSEEREWRLVSKTAVSIMDPQVRFRTARWTLIPYYLFQLCEESAKLRIEHVYVGPNPNMDRAVNAAYWFLWNAGVKFPQATPGKPVPAIDVRPSAVPYRGW